MAARGNGRERAGVFAETVWGAITYPARAGAERQKRAGAEFYRIYWGPVFGLVSGRGFGFAQAEDLTQDFLLHFLASGALMRARREKGRFRDFLGAALRHYLVNRHARDRAQKRGGDLIAVEIEAVDGWPTPPGERPQLPVCNCDREWAALLARALERLREHYRGVRRQLFDALRPGLIGEDDTSYEQLSAHLHRSCATLRSEMARMRRQLRTELLREAPDAALEDLREILRHR
ncbi:MAG: sigma-70 family RNA polymerase sigma factor [Chthoniobacterales bacterium]